MASFDWRKLSRPITLVLITGIAIAVLVHLWHYYNAEPWTRDGRVRGDVIQVSSDVSGLVTEVLVHDNQSVKQGQVLFKIDVARQALDVEQAKSDLAISKQEQDQMFAVRDQSHAEHEQMQAAIQQAKANIAQQQALIDVATSNLHLAELNLNRSEVVAPADGTLSNFEMKAGNYVKVGQAVAALLDRSQLYVVGYFEETKLNKIYLGAPATVQLMGDSNILKGHVQGIASGIEDRERTTSTGLLANVNPTFSWVRLAQRVPVKIALDDIPKNELAFVAGRTVTVHITESQH